MATKQKTRNRYYNPNPLKQEGADCVVRAFCKATGKDWDTVYNELCDLGRELKDMPNSDRVWKAYVGNEDEFIEHTIRIKKGMRRPTVDSFAREHKQGTYVLSVANHLVTVVDGFHYDTWDCSDKSVYKYWEKK